MGESGGGGGGFRLRKRNILSQAVYQKHSTLEEVLVTDARKNQKEVRR